MSKFSLFIKFFPPIKVLWPIAVALLFALHLVNFFQQRSFAKKDQNLTFVGYKLPEKQKQVTTLQKVLEVENRKIDAVLQEKLRQIKSFQKEVSLWLKANQDLARNSNQFESNSYSLFNQAQKVTKKTTSSLQSYANLNKGINQNSSKLRSNTQIVVKEATQIKDENKRLKAIATENLLSLITQIGVTQAKLNLAFNYSLRIKKLLASELSSKDRAQLPVAPEIPKISRNANIRIRKIINPRLFLIRSGASQRLVAGQTLSLVEKNKPMAHFIVISANGSNGLATLLPKQDVLPKVKIQNGFLLVSMETPLDKLFKL